MRFLDFLFPPKCVSCGCVLDSASKIIHQKGGDSLCKKCRGEWEKAKLDQCYYCRRPMMDCLCSTQLMRRKGNNVLLKLCPYIGDPRGTVKQVIFALKRNADKRIELFAAHQLYEVLKKYAAKYLGGDLILTNVPRRKGGYSKYGYDHSRLLAENLSILSGIPYIPILKRVKEGKEQKYLTEEQRCENIKGAFILADEEISLGGKCIVLVDDVVTTGASINECIFVLKSANPAAILPVCVAKTTKVYKADDGES